MHGIGFRCWILSLCQSISIIRWVGALPGIVSLFTTSVAYIWIPSSTFPRMSLTALLARWVVFKVLLLRLITLTPLTRGFTLLLEVRCLIRLIIGFRPSVGILRLTIIAFLSLILSSFKISSPFFFQLGQSIFYTNGPFYAFPYRGRQTTPTLNRQCDVRTEHIHHSSQPLYFSVYQERA